MKKRLPEWVVYEGVPEIVQPRLTSVLCEHLWIVPTWCQHLYLQWHAESAETPTPIAEVETQYEYRRVLLRVYANWLQLSPARQTDALLHELLHIPTTPLVDYAKETIETLLLTAPLEYRQSILRELEVRMESVTQDLTHSLTEYKRQQPAKRR